MNLSLFIARRYFLSKKKKNFINILSYFSMLGVAVGTMALIVVLSVFNGLEKQLRSLYTSFDPEIKVQPQIGKSFERSDSLLELLSGIEGVALLTEVVEDNALLRYRENQMVVKIKGMSQNFLEQNRMNHAIVDGRLIFEEDNIPYAIIGRGVQIILGISIKNDFYAMQLYYPKNISPSPNLNPSQMYTRKNIMPGGVFALEKSYDEQYVFVPLDFAVGLLDYGQRRTALEVKLASGASARQVKRRIQEALGSDFRVLDADEQHSDLFKLLKIEKLFVFITFSFILAIASFNIFFSLTMLAIDKKKDLSVLYALGASDSFIKRIFLFEGAIIAFTGAFLGLALGLLLCHLQDQFGLISMGMQTSILESYPIDIQFMDLFYTTLSIILITFLAAYRPAIVATKSKKLEYL